MGGKVELLSGVILEHSTLRTQDFDLRGLFSESSGSTAAVTAPQGGDIGSAWAEFSMEDVQPLWVGHSSFRQATRVLRIRGGAVCL